MQQPPRSVPRRAVVDESMDTSDGGNAPGEHDAICRSYLKSFLKGSTDARDECEGLLNAYDAAGCSSEEDGGDGRDFERWWKWWWSRVFGDDDEVYDDEGGESKGGNDDQVSQIDDFYEQFKCCDTIHSYYSIHCHSSQIHSAAVLLIVFVLLLCGLVKALIRTFRIGWLPEAAGCILVGSTVGAILALKFPETDFVHSFSFDDELFMCVLLPPIVFQAALSIDKKTFRKQLIPIVAFAVLGTIFSAVLAGWIVHLLSSSCSFLTSIPLLDSLVFGSLIASVDPVATLSILSSVGVSETDALYVLVFGESLLNDGAAIVLFRSMVHRLDRTASYSDESIVWETVQRFVVISVGSASIGLGCGILCAIYFFLLRGKQSPVLEVSTFFCWALVPYYVADAVGGSGIVAILTLGFFADAFVVGERRAFSLPANTGGVFLSTEDSLEQDESLNDSISSDDCSTREGFYVVRRVLSSQGHLSSLARRHIDFVAEVLASVMETAVFAYMGLFLFAERQFQNIPLNLTAIFACVASRLVVVAALSWIMNMVGGMLSRPWLRRSRHPQNDAAAPQLPMIDKRTQLILLLSGMRGAVSVALAENVPLYNAVTMSGSKVKLEIKAMTSSSIIFTIFNFGALTYFVLEKRRRISPAEGSLDSAEEEQQQEPLLESSDFGGNVTP